MAHSNTCSYSEAARSHDMSCVIPLCMTPSQESLCSRYVKMAVHSACQRTQEREKGRGRRGARTSVSLLSMLQAVRGPVGVGAPHQSIRESFNCTDAREHAMLREAASGPGPLLRRNRAQQPGLTPIMASFVRGEKVHLPAP